MSITITFVDQGVPRLEHGESASGEVELIAAFIGQERRPALFKRLLNDPVSVL